MILYLIAAMLSGTAATDHRFDIRIGDVIVPTLRSNPSRILPVLLARFVHVNRAATFVNVGFDLVQTNRAQTFCGFDKVASSKVDQQGRIRNRYSCAIEVRLINRELSHSSDLGTRRL